MNYQELIDKVLKNKSLTVFLGIVGGGYALWLDRWLMHLKILGVLSVWIGLPRCTKN